MVRKMIVLLSALGFILTWLDGWRVLPLSINTAI